MEASGSYRLLNGERYGQKKKGNPGEGEHVSPGASVVTPRIPPEKRLHMGGRGIVRVPRERGLGGQQERTAQKTIQGQEQKRGKFSSGGQAKRLRAAALSRKEEEVCWGVSPMQSHHGKVPSRQKSARRSRGAAGEKKEGGFKARRDAKRPGKSSPL